MAAPTEFDRELYSEVEPGMRVTVRQKLIESEANPEVLFAFITKNTCSGRKMFSYLDTRPFFAFKGTSKADTNVPYFPNNKTTFLGTAFCFNQRHRL